MGNHGMAAIYARKVIDAGKFSLKEKTEVINDVAGVLSRKETIFGIYFPGFYTNVSGKLQQVTSYFSLDLRDDFMSIYEKDASGLDFRTMAYFFEAGVGDDMKYRLSKLTDIYELNNMVSNRPEDLILGVNLIRLPEMYYIAAEALLDSDYDTALALYNDVRTHRGLDPLEEEKTLTVELINDERYKEMIGEGHTYFNMKRQNLPILSYDGKSTYYPVDGIYSIPVPDVEIENRN
jgi:hypothetical protein